MPELHDASVDFWRAYQELPQEIRDRADKQFALLKVSPEPLPTVQKSWDYGRQRDLVSPRDVELPGARLEKAEGVPVVLDQRP